MRCHSGFVDAFTEYRQSRFSIILKGSRIFRIDNDIGFKSPSTVGPTKSQPVV